ncbi:hypothetical protein [Candidatus Nitrosocosmicus hydrocola]|uniref:hypothetical protein n=1 Tax=Candidatus Nitrosocosmicus hydrocola TaxID=1826872 RepID=UPI000AE86DCA|nr:hypothetical protein [Candidatus Nitrosocosmicus hydrocola]
MSIYNHAKKVDVEIPLLLAGPIIRRVEKSKVCIWISTSKKVQAKIRIFRIYGHEGGVQGNSSENIVPTTNDTLLETQPNLQLVGEGINTPLQLGDNLFINLIIAKPLNQFNNKKEVLKNDNKFQEFPANELLAYDLELISNSEKTGIKETITLKDLGLLSGVNSIIYHRHNDNSLSYSTSERGKNGINYPDLPMFFIPEKEDDSSFNLLYGSCRKLHGDDEDSLIIGDKIMSDFFYDLKKRPSVLFLIGDQIYADDVAGPLITFIKKFSSNILGWDESINGIEKKLDKLEIGERREIVRKYANFSTDVGDNHLLGFSEFAAMYLLAWNPENWPKQFEQLEKKSSLSSSSFEKKYLNELKELEESRLTLAGVRRLLANVPTYMICDDHEITDDWNINKRWCDEVEQSSCGKQIISNGLAAYWAFQAWGNDPDSFDNNFIEKIIRYLNLKKPLGSAHAEFQTSSTTTPYESSFNQRSENIVLSEIQDLEKLVLLNKNWTFVAPTYPLSVFLDCRTQRTFVDEEGPPYLLSEDALEYMKFNLIKSEYKNGDPIILISPTPVFGFELAESVQRFLTSISGSYKWDLETWRANEKGFSKFLTFLASNFDPAYCIFLSGDVHYAFTMKAHIDHLKRTREMGSFADREINTKQKSVIPIAQLTSSPFRSNSLTNRIVAILILNMVHKLVIFKKYIFGKKLANKSPDDVNFNYDYLKRLPDDRNQRDNTGNSSSYGDKQKIYFSKHRDDKSIFEKIRVIAFNLKVKLFKKDSIETNHINSPWTERRLLIKPRGQSSLPVLAKNNMGYVKLDLDSRSINHMLYFLDKGIITNSQAKIHL